MGEVESVIRKVRKLQGNQGTWLENFKGLYLVQGRSVQEFAYTVIPRYGTTIVPGKVDVAAAPKLC